MSTTYTNCTSCGAKLGGLLGRYHAGDGLCGVCHDERILAARDPERATRLAREAEDATAAAAVLVTTETVPSGLRISRRIDIVAADVAYGQNIIKDIKQNARDIFGGRSVTLQDTIRNSRAEAIKELRVEAHKLGANAVVGVTVQIVNIDTAPGTSMNLVSASGTAVVVEL